MEGDRGRKAFAVRIMGEEVPAQAGPGAEVAPAEDEQLCDVLSQAEFTQDITEMLLNTALSGQQVLQVRQGVLEFAVKHGWVDA